MCGGMLRMRRGVLMSGVVSSPDFPSTVDSEFGRDAKNQRRFTQR